MSGRYPPHHEIALIHPLEPLVAAAIEAFVHGLPHEALKRFGAVPYRKVDRHARVAGERAGLDSASAVVLVTPHKSRAALRQTVTKREVIHALRHARISDLVAQASDIELGKVKRGHGGYPSVTRPPPAPAPGAGLRCSRRCVARSRDGNGGSGLAPARPRRRRTRRWCVPRSGSSLPSACRSRACARGLPPCG